MQRVSLVSMRSKLFRGSNCRFRIFHRWSRFARLTICAGLCALGLGWISLRFVPLPPALLQPSPQSLELTDRYGTPLRQTRNGERFARDVPLAEVPPVVVHAMLAAEDKRFFEHSGVDLLALSRAAAGNLRHHRVTSGASTITQQLVKVADPRPRTLATKLFEAARAWRLEQLWSKDEILEAYLNRIDFGNLNIGIAAAADFYFGKPLSDLSDAEAAFLAGLPKNPSRLNPHGSFDRAKRRQETVLGRMEGNQWLTAEARARAARETLHLQSRQRMFRAPHFVDLALREVPSAPGASLATTLDLNLNRYVEDIVRSQLSKLRERNVHDGAVVVLDNRTAEVLALVGSGNFFAPGDGQVNGALARRSAGSTFKPFTYLLALEHGDTPATVVADVPAVFDTPGGGYRPANYNQRCSGPIRYRLALANSLNIPAVRVLSSIGGAAPVQERLRSWGMTTLERPADYYGLGLTIGNAETRLIELANAYSALARLGEWKPYRLWLGPAMAPIQRSACNARPPSEETAGAAWLIADMLSDNSARAQSFGLHSPLRFDFPVACKTGTSTDFRDNWSMGYTPEFTVGVWVGNFDGTPMRDVSGVTGAAPILHAVFEHLHSRFGTTWYAKPKDVVELMVDPFTGKQVMETQLDAVRETFLRGHLPPMGSPDDYDETGRVRLGPEYRAWSESAENTLASRISCAPTEGALRLVSPLPGTTFLIDPDLPSTRRVLVRSMGVNAPVWESGTLRFDSEGDRTYAVVTEGRHRLTVRDPATGQMAETWIKVNSL
jgi:penicillin-binding protein 1C